jgi:hypothetical protein
LLNELKNGTSNSLFTNFFSVLTTQQSFSIALTKLLQDTDVQTLSLTLNNNNNDNYFANISNEDDFITWLKNENNFFEIVKSISYKPYFADVVAVRTNEEDPKDNKKNISWFDKFENHM